VPKLRREQLKRNYKPNPFYIKRIASKASIPLEIQTTNDDMIVEARLKYIEENELFPAPSETDPKKLKPKIPTISIMGHVDHGKTTLLDHLRKSKLADNEAGGITQAIGAFTLALDGQDVTVLDTPGHATFDHMRERGSSVVDLVVLVVAADDGIMAQTFHSYKLIKRFHQPFIVAITKIDKSNAKPTAIEKQILEQFDVDKDDIVKISAQTGSGMDDFVTILSSKLDELNLQAPVSGPCEGYILESRSTMAGIGRPATVLVKRGTLNKKDLLIAGESLCKVKMIIGEGDKPLKKLLPGQFAEIIGWDDIPHGGDYFQVTTSAVAQKAKKFRLEEKQKQKDDEFNVKTKRDIGYEKQLIQAKLDSGYYKLDALERYHLSMKANMLMQQAKEELRDRSLHFLVKTDVYGSLEAIVDNIAKYERRDDQEPEMDVKQFDIGQITVADVEEAISNKLSIINFSQPISKEIQNLINENDVQVYNHDVIYKLFDEVETDLKKLMPTDFIDEEIGSAVVKKSFQTRVNPNRAKEGAIGGCVIQSGIIKKDHYFRIYRKHECIYEGDCTSLLHIQTEMDQIDSGEFGIALDWVERGFLPGDIIKCFYLDSEHREPDWVWQ